MNRLLLFSLLLLAADVQPVRFLTPRVLKMGRVREGDLVTGTIQFYNKGKSPLHLVRVKTSCGCTAARPSQNEIMPGDTASVEVTLNTLGFQGVIRKTVTLQFREKVAGSNAVKIEADVFSELEIKPRFFHFQQVGINPDTLITRELTISNHGLTPISLHLKLDEGQMVSLSCDSLQVPAGTTQMVQIQLRPTEKTNQALYLLIDSDYEVKPRVHVPVFVYIK